MRLLDRKTVPPTEELRPTEPSRATGLLHDLGLGIRFASSGGREGWTRTVLTAVGVGLGVALLLFASSIPHLLEQRSARDQARAEARVSRDHTVPKSDTTVLQISVLSEYRGRSVEGSLMRPEGHTRSPRPVRRTSPARAKWSPRPP